MKDSCKLNTTNNINNLDQLDQMIPLILDNYLLKTLPDLVEPELQVLFVGTNPGAKSARIGHYFAGTSNMFWKLLYESTLTDRRLSTEFDYQLLEYSYGLTDVVKRPTRSTTELRKTDAKGAKKRLDNIIKKNIPKIVAFIGKTGFRYYLSEDNIPLKYGIQDLTIKESNVYLLPSTSGASFADTNYSEKLFWYRKLKKYVSKTD